MSRKTISRRDFISAAGAGAAGLAFMHSSCSGRVDQRRPNFIVTMADDCSAREFGCYGNKEHKTPNLDALANTGMMFKTCWCTPICSPSRAQIMTGRYGFRTKWYHNSMKPGGGGYDLARAELLFSEFMKNSGYATAVAGKWQIGAGQDQQGNYRVHEYGFNEFCLWASGGIAIPKGAQYDGYTEGPNDSVPGRTDRYWHPAVVRNGELIPTGEDDYGPDIYTDFVNDFAARHTDEPFFIYYPMCLPHGSWYPPISEKERRTVYVPVPELDERGNKTGRRTPEGFRYNVEYVDHLIGRIVRNLDMLKIRDNTIIMFTCDNGTAGYGKAQLTGERGSRVPMIVNCPGIVKPSEPRDELVQFADVLPTMEDLAGLALPGDEEFDGISFAPVLLDREGPRREWIFSYYADKRFLRDKRWLLDGNGRLWDCGDNRSGEGYKDVTDSKDPEVLQVRKRFEEILKNLPGPDPGDPLVARYYENERALKEQVERMRKAGKAEQ